MPFVGWDQRRSTRAVGITIVPFREEWQEEVQRLLWAYLEERWGVLDLSLNPDILDIKSSFHEGLFVVALDAGNVVGTGGILPETATSARVVRMTVSRERRGAGIGTLILDYLVQEALKRDNTSLVLETTETWESAIAFYLRYGFQLLGCWEGDAHFRLELF